MIKAIKRSQMNFIAVPKYSEISVEKLWSFVHECENLKEYFPDLEVGKLPEIDFLMGILSSLRFDEMKELIKEARDNRALTCNNDTDLMVEVTKSAGDQLLSLLPTKSKYLFIGFNHNSLPWKSPFSSQEGCKAQAS